MIIKPNSNNSHIQSFMKPNSNNNSEMFHFLFKYNFAVEVIPCFRPCVRLDMSGLNYSCMEVSLTNISQTYNMCDKKYKLSMNSLNI